MLQLNKNNNIHREGPIVLIIMDGVGFGKKNEGDAFHLANTPLLDNLLKTCPYTSLKAHGTSVGLPSDGDMGNSEVGHNALGAGRIFSQGAKLVENAMEDNSIFESETWKALLEKPRNNKSTLHFIGLFSDGNVHSHISHLFKMISRAADEGVSSLKVHILLDGRDVPETSALEYVEQLEAHLSQYSEKGLDYKIASGGGRMITTMDRYEADWNIVKRGWEAHVLGSARGFSSAKEAIETYRKEEDGITDQYLPSFTIVDDNGPVGTIEDGDSVIFFNFRGDRSIEISRAFEEESFTYFDRVRKPQVVYAGMMEYDGDLHIPQRYLVSPPAIDSTISEYLANEKIKQYAISETQKYGHVTYFWNGNRSGKFDETTETYVEIPSDKIEFDKRPWMKAEEITEKVSEAIRSNEFDFIRLNYANGDMVGHTGNLPAARIAMETVDLCMGRILDAVEETGGVALITADHGNLDEMFEIDKKSGEFKKDKDTGELKKKTSHTLNPVPFIIYDPKGKNEYSLSDIEDPGLGNVAATIFNFLGFDVPEGYFPSLISFK
mgnify:CR=1 FL=1